MPTDKKKLPKVSGKIPPIQNPFKKEKKDLPKISPDIQKCLDEMFHDVFN